MFRFDSLLFPIVPVDDDPRRTAIWSMPIPVFPAPNFLLLTTNTPVTMREEISPKTKTPAATVMIIKFSSFSKDWTQPEGEPDEWIVPVEFSAAEKAEMKEDLSKSSKSMDERIKNGETQNKQIMRKSQEGN